MTRQEYTEQVLAQLRRLTWEEQEAVREEIDAHMEDHICDLLELGYEEPLAEERALAWMGDPTEVGRELDRQYPFHWLILGRLAKLLAVLMILPMLVSFFLTESPLLSCVKARVDPWEPGRLRAPEMEQSELVDIRTAVGDDILRVYQVALDTMDGQRVARVYGVAYDQTLFGLPAEWIFGEMTLEDQRGEAVSSFGGYGRDDRTQYPSGYVPIQPEDTYVVLRGDRYGHRFSLEVPLPKEGVQ